LRKRYEEIRAKKYKDLFENYKPEDVYDSSAELSRKPQKLKKVPVERF
jgi:hypothetical protein